IYYYLYIIPLLLPPLLLYTTTTTSPTICTTTIITSTITTYTIYTTTTTTKSTSTTTITTHHRVFFQSGLTTHEQYSVSIDWSNRSEMGDNLGFTEGPSDVIVSDNVTNSELSLDSPVKKRFSIIAYIVYDGEDGADDEEESPPLTPYCWVVLAMSFLSVSIGTGVIGSMSVFYVEFLRAFDNTKAEVAVVPSLASGMYDIGGVLAGVMIDRLGCRVSMVIGGMLTSASLAISFVAPSIYFLIFFLGFVSALGTSIVMLSGMVLVGQTFTPKNPVGTVIVSASHPSGFVIFPIIIPYIIESYGWRGSLLILSGITLNIIPFGLVATYGLPKTKKVVKEKPVESAKSKKSVRTRCVECCPFDLELFQTGQFQLFAITSAIIWSSNYLIHLLIVDFGKDRGYTMVQSSSLLTVLGITAIVSRFLALLIAKFFQRTSNMFLFLVFSLLATILHGCVPFSNSFESLTTVVALSGTIFGLRFSYFMLALIDLVSMDKYSQALGYTLTLWGVSVALLGPIVGAVSSVTGSYDLSYHCGGLVGAVSLIPITWYLYCKTPPPPAPPDILHHQPNTTDKPIE
ncbi:monocarboxylate transporter 2 isoform X1, partial [Argonauta hians]